MTRSRLVMPAAIAVIAVMAAFGIIQVSKGDQAQAAKLPQLYISQIQEIDTGESIPVCAAADSVKVKYAKLDWFHALRHSKLTRPRGMQANCRLYTAPRAPGTDTITVAYMTSPSTAIGAQTTFPVRKAPPRPK